MSSSISVGPAGASAGLRIVLTAFTTRNTPNATSRKFTRAFRNVPKPIDHAVHLEVQGSRPRLAEDRADERQQDEVDERADHGRERHAEHDRDRQIEDVAAVDEVLELLEHGPSFRGDPACRAGYAESTPREVRRRKTSGGATQASASRNTRSIARRHRRVIRR